MFFFLSYKITNAIYTSTGLASHPKRDATACHVTAAISRSLSESATHATSRPPSLATNARRRGFLVPFPAGTPSLAPEAGQRGSSIIFYGDSPLPHSQRETEGFLVYFLCRHPVPHSHCETDGLSLATPPSLDQTQDGGGFLLFRQPPPPSLAPNARGPQ